MTYRLLAPVIALVALAACNPATSMCHEASRCADSEVGLTECLDGADASAQQAREVGCGGEQGALNRCLHSNSTCNNGNYSIAVAECGSEMEALAQCQLDAAFN